MPTSEPTPTITQRRFLSSRQFTIDGHVLKVEYRHGLSLEQERFNLDSFEPEPLRIKRVPLGKAAISLTTLALAVVLLRCGFRTGHDNAAATAMVWGLLFAFATFFLAVGVCFGFSDVTVFKGESFHQIRLWHNLPDPVAFDGFINTLSEAIREARRNNPVSSR